MLVSLTIFHYMLEKDDSAHLRIKLNSVYKVNIKNVNLKIFINVNIIKAAWQNPIGFGLFSS